jgi:hypothetical protein
MNRGGVGARSLNIELRAALNPAGERKVERFGWTFAPGDSTTNAKRRSGNGGFTSSAEPPNAKSPSLVRSKFGCFYC